MNGDQKEPQRHKDTENGAEVGVEAPLSLEVRLELANRLYREYHTRFFWHCPRELVITEDLISLVVSGLRKHGGRQGFILAGKLQ